MSVTNFRKYLNARGFKQLVNCVLFFLARPTGKLQAPVRKATLYANNVVMLCSYCNRNVL